MAPRMKVWLGLVLGGILLVGLWGLPPKSYEEWQGARWGRDREEVPERRAFRQVRTEAWGKNRLFQLLQWRDSVEALAGTARENGRLWSVALPDPAPEHLLPGLEAAVLAQIAAEDIGVPRVPVGVVLMEGRTGTHPSVPNGSFDLSLDSEVYVGLEAGSPYCYLVKAYLGNDTALEGSWADLVWAPADSSAPPNPLGPCAFHAKYGTPGPGVFQWLADGHYAMTLGGSRFRKGREAGGEGGRAIPALGRRTLWSEGSPDAEACLAGKVEGCRRALFGDWVPYLRAWWTDPGDRIVDDHGLVVPIQSFGYFLPFGGREYGLLLDLEAEFGRQRFQAFWSSDLDVEEAFRQAFGGGFPEWVMGWGQARFGKSEVGANVPLEAALLSFLAIGVLSGAALLLGRRRR